MFVQRLKTVDSSLCALLTQSEEVKLFEIYYEQQLFILIAFLQLFLSYRQWSMSDMAQTIKFGAFPLKPKAFWKLLPVLFQQEHLVYLINIMFLVSL